MNRSFECELYVNNSIYIFYLPHKLSNDKFTNLENSGFIAVTIIDQKYIYSINACYLLLKRLGIYMNVKDCQRWYLTKENDYVMSECIN